MKSFLKSQSNVLLRNTSYWYQDDTFILMVIQTAITTIRKGLKSKRRTKKPRNEKSMLFDKIKPLGWEWLWSPSVLCWTKSSLISPLSVWTPASFVFPLSHLTTSHQQSHVLKYRISLENWFSSLAPISFSFSLLTQVRLWFAFLFCWWVSLYSVLICFL